jgi:hypothetical protein
MSQVPEDPELEEVEAALRTLVPGPSRLDRDRLLFEAGASSTRGGPWHRWAWPSAAAVLAMAVAAESVLLANRPAPTVVERLVVIHEPPAVPPFGSATAEASAAGETLDPVGAFTNEVVVPNRRDEAASDPSDAPAPSRWLTAADSRRLRDFALRFDADRLPEPPRWNANVGDPAGGPGASPASVGELRRLGLEKWLNPGDRS